MKNIKQWFSFRTFSIPPQSIYIHFGGELATITREPAKLADDKGQRTIYEYHLHQTLTTGIKPRETWVKKEE